MSGSDPTGYGWLDSISVGDAVGAMVMAGHAVSYAILLSSGDSTSGAAPTSGGITTGSLAGSALGIGHAAHGLANAGVAPSSPAPMGAFGSGAESQGGLYNEYAGAAPPRSQGALAAGDEWCGGKWTEQGCSYVSYDIFGGLPILPSFGDVARGVQGAWAWLFRAETAAEILMPGGVRIGQAGASGSVRVLQGGEPATRALFQRLAAGGTKFTGAYAGEAISLPGGGFVGIRTVATSSLARAAPRATIDVNIPGIAIRELKFLP